MYKKKCYDNKVLIYMQNNGLMLVFEEYYNFDYIVYSKDVQLKYLWVVEVDL